MKIKPVLVLLALGVPLAALFVADVARAEEDAAAVSKEQLALYDKGPSSIDVSAYPAGIPDEWSRYIKRMMHKPGSMISPGQAKKIYEFLAFDSSVRKKALFDERLSKAAAADKADAEARIKEIIDLYAQK